MILIYHESVDGDGCIHCRLFELIHCVDKVRLAIVKYNNCLKE